MRLLAVQGEGGQSGKADERSLVPSPPKTAYGEQLAYYLKMEPQLFAQAVEDQLTRLKEEKDVRDKARDTAPNSMEGLALHRRMTELREREASATLEDLMYVCILEKFLALGVDMLPRMDGLVDLPIANLSALTEGLHSREALELVREHLLQVMGSAAQFPQAHVKMSKFQMAQVYAASIMFGYFLRRVDARFKLDQTMGSLPPSREDAVARLERLFAQAEDIEAASDPDYALADVVDMDAPSTSGRGPAGAAAPPGPLGPATYRYSKWDSSAGEATAMGSDMAVPPSASPPASSAPPSSQPLVWGTAADPSGPGVGAEGQQQQQRGAQGAASAPGVGSAGSSGNSNSNLPATRPKSSLRRYVEAFDQGTMVAMARIVSVEGAALVERQTCALVGDLKRLSQQMQMVVEDAGSFKEAMSKVAKAVEIDQVDTLTMSTATQRRAVLEAVAFGTFLFDTESWVGSGYTLLTPLPTPPASGAPGRGPGGPAGTRPGGPPAGGGNGSEDGGVGGGEVGGPRTGGGTFA